LGGAISINLNQKIKYFNAIFENNLFYLNKARIGGAISSINTIYLEFYSNVLINNQVTATYPNIS